MKDKHWHCVHTTTLNANARKAGVVNLDAKHVLGRAAKHQTQNQACDAGMPYDEYSLPGIRGANIGPRCGYTCLKTRE